MGKRNYLIEGVSGAGKTSVCNELQRRGYHVINGDQELADRGYPETGEPLSQLDYERAINNPEWGQKHWLWDIDKVKSLIADHSTVISFFCGGSRNYPRFIDLLDGVFVLEVDDLDLLLRRIDERVALDPTDWGGKPEEKELIKRLHATKEDIPKGIIIDATRPVVNEILMHTLDLMQNNKKPTPYHDINSVVNYFLTHIKEILGVNFVGMYLYGSLATGDFDKNTSDIDFIVITDTEIPENEFILLQALHHKFNLSDTSWSKKIEAAYIEKKELGNYEVTTSLYLK